MRIDVIGEKLPEEEIQAYRKYVREKYPDMKITRLVIKADGNFVDLTCHTEVQRSGTGSSMILLPIQSLL